jgi:hypothetical protein
VRPFGAGPLGFEPLRRKVAWDRIAYGMEVYRPPELAACRARHRRRALGLMWAAIASPSLADVKDYEFRLVRSEMKKGDGAIVAVQISSPN